MLKKILSGLAIAALLSAEGCTININTYEPSFTSETENMKTQSNDTSSLSEVYWETRDIDILAQIDFDKSDNKIELVNTAIQWLKENADQIYASKDNMKKTIYYGGTLLEATKEDYRDILESSDMSHNIGLIGYYAEYSVFYVYAGESNIDDPEIQSNYENFKEYLKKV